MEYTLMLMKMIDLLEKKGRRKLFFLVLFSILISIIEMVGISIIMPFISIASDFSLINSNETYKKIYDFFNFETPVSFVVAFGVVLILFYIFRSIINLLYYYLMSRYTDGRYRVFAYRLFRKYLSMPYESFINQNSTVLTKTIINEAENLTQLLSHLLLLLSEIFVVLLIYTVLLYVNWNITLILSIVLILKGVIFILVIGRLIRSQGEKREFYQQNFYKIITSTFGNFKLIKLMGKDLEILKKVDEVSSGFAHANVVNRTIQQLPRLLLEAIGFGAVTFVITYLVWENKSDIHEQLGMISMFILGLYRLMPSFNRIISSYNRIEFYRKSLSIIHNDLFDLKQEHLGEYHIEFHRKIFLDNVSFRFDSHIILDQVYFEIKKGDKVGIIGESGSGKSTLLDLIMGLCLPKEGSIYVDDVLLDNKYLNSWRKKIGYIPQQIYLFDGTVSENIVFGREYDENELISVLKSVELWEFLSKKEGLYTRVGEGGIMLSGGQKQRIAIARAIYGNPEILILDEATAALDNETEYKIMNKVYSIIGGRTLIVVAHRVSTLSGCNKIYKVEHGKVLRCRKEDIL